MSEQQTNDLRPVVAWLREDGRDTYAHRVEQAADTIARLTRERDEARALMLATARVEQALRSSLDGVCALVGVEAGGDPTERVREMREMALWLLANDTSLPDDTRRAAVLALKGVE